MAVSSSETYSEEDEILGILGNVAGKAVIGMILPIGGDLIGDLVGDILADAAGDLLGELFGD